MIQTCRMERIHENPHLDSSLFHEQVVIFLERSAASAILSDDIVIQQKGNAMSSGSARSLTLSAGEDRFKQGEKGILSDDADLNNFADQRRPRPRCG